MKCLWCSKELPKKSYRRKFCCLEHNTNYRDKYGRGEKDRMDHELYIIQKREEENQEYYDSADLLVM